MADVSILNRKRPFWPWFLIGVTAAVVLQVGQARVMGGSPAGLLNIGSGQEVHSVVVEELPSAPVFEGQGHDGMIFYAVALDPAALGPTDHFRWPAYRYRRILLPAVASGFGTWGGQPLLWGMILLTSLPVGLAAGTTAVLARERGLNPMLAAAVVLTPGVWLSTRLLTAENLGMALSLLGVLAVLRRRDVWAVLALSGAALTKEPFVAFALGLGLWLAGDRQWRRAIRVAAVPVITMAAWWSYVALSVGNPLSSEGNATLPILGLVKAAPIWSSMAGSDNTYIAITMLTVIVCIWVVVADKGLWAALTLPWVVIATLTSELVWGVGNNAARAFAPLLTLAVLGVAQVVQSRRAEPRSVEIGS